MHCACVIFSSVACPALQNLFALSHKRYHFRKNLLNTKWDLIFSTTFARNISHSKKNSARCNQKSTKAFMWSTRYSCPVLMKLYFLDKFSKNNQISNFIKIRPLGTELFRADGQKDTKLIVAFRNYTNAPKNVFHVSFHKSTSWSLVTTEQRHRNCHGILKNPRNRCIKVTQEREVMDNFWLFYLCSS
jgi:hypothetical protein